MFSILGSICDKAALYSPPGLILSVMSAFLVDGKYVAAYRHEFIGTLLMIAFTFSAGKWIGVDTWQVAWLSHAMGVIAADKIGGGAQVNPAVSVSMWCLGKVDGYTELYVRVMGQMGGGLIAFPIYQYLAQTLSWNPLGGPDFSYDDVDDAFLSEFLATILLCIAIYALNWELNFGTYHYWIKQTLTAVVIRLLIEVFPTAGPAMNPMLGTAWAVFSSGFDDENQWKSTGTIPTDFEHYFVYWISPILGAIVASYLYVIYAGGTFFGTTLSTGPFKKQSDKKKSD